MATPAAITALHDALSSHARTNDKKTLIQCLSRHLTNHALPLDPAPPLDPAIALQDVSRERVVFNEVPFLSASSSLLLRDNNDQDGGGGGGGGGGINTPFIEALYELSDKICSRDDIATSPRELVEGLLRRMSRSGSGADSYFKLNSLLGSPDLILMPRQPEGGRTLPPPISLDVYVAGGSVHASISCTNMYGLYRKADLKGINGGGGGGGGKGGERAAWINVDAVVEERVNFGNGKGVRFLKVIFPTVGKALNGSKGVGGQRRGMRSGKYPAGRNYRE